MQKIVSKIIVMVLSTFIGLFVIETTLDKVPIPFEPIESVHTYSQFNVLYGVEPKANLNYPEYDEVVRTNSDATFGPEIKKDGTPSILHLGDSYTAGPGIAYEKNYPFLLQQMINASSATQYQSVILGMGGSSPMQQNIIFERKLTDLRPSLVVYELYDNDATDDYAFSLSQYYARISTYERMPTWLRETAIGKRIFLFFANSLTEKFAAEYAREKEFKFTDLENIWKDLTQPALASIKQRAAEKGAPFVLFYIPSGWEFQDEYSTNSAQPRHPQAEFAKQWAAEQNVPFVDFYPQFAASNTAQLNELYLDDTKGFHLTERGTKMVADELYRIITERELLKSE